MALQVQAALLHSALSVPKKGNLGAVAKEPAFLSVTQKAKKPSLVVRAVATAPPVASPGTTTSKADGKKTLRQGVVVITGASSGLGLAAAKALAETGKWHVVMACRDFLKAATAAKSAGMAAGSYTIMHLDLASLDSVRQFVENFRRSDMPLDALVCNAAIYRPTARQPTFTADGYEMSVGVNHLGHFLLARLMLDDLKKSDYPSRRLIILGSITGNTNTLAGNVPPKAGLGDLRGLAGGLRGQNGSAMIDGAESFDGAKAYKDSKTAACATPRRLPPCRQRMDGRIHAAARHCSLTASITQSCRPPSPFADRLHLRALARLCLRILPVLVAIALPVPSVNAWRKHSHWSCRWLLCCCTLFDSVNPLRPVDGCSSSSTILGIESVYWWEGKVQTDAEELLIIKTRESLLDALTEHVKANHEYDVPEVIALPIKGGNLKYLEWLKNSTREN